MTDVTLLPGERLDDLCIKNLRIIQHPEEFCFSLDAVLLAHFARITARTEAVDLGTGTGVVAMLLAARGVKSVTGVEISPYLADMASRSVGYNKLAATIRIIRHDLRDIKECLPSGGYGLVVANPPYRPVGRGYMNPNDRVAAARHELTATLADVIAAARYLVKYRGRFAMVHLPERAAEILRAMSDAGLEPKRLQLVYPTCQAKPKFLLVEAVRGAACGLDVLPPLFVYNSDGSYSRQILEYYRGEA